MKNVYGKRLTPLQAVEAIHGLLDGTEWDSGTTEAIAEIIVATGRDIREPDEVDRDVSNP